MRTPYKPLILASVMCLAVASPTSAMPFQNLDFEMAADGGPSLPIWSVGRVAGYDPPLLNDHSIGPVTSDSRGFNGFCLGTRCLTMVNRDVQFPTYYPLEGDYSIVLQGGTLPRGSIYIEQTGDVPIEARSIRLQAAVSSSGLISEIRLFANGVPLAPLVEFAADSRSHWLTTDISPWAGQSTVLRVAVVAGPDADAIETNALIDSIQFSPVTVPEPGTAVLLSLGLAMLARRPRPQAAMPGTR